jgi:hypothetical protein
LATFHAITDVHQVNSGLISQVSIIQSFSVLSAAQPITWSHIQKSTQSNFKYCIVPIHPVQVIVLVLSIVQDEVASGS